MTIRIFHGDCLTELPKLAAAGERFHAVVTDPPYGLEFMGKEWDGAKGFRRSLNEAEPDWPMKGAAPDKMYGRKVVGQYQKKESALGNMSRFPLSPNRIRVRHGRDRPAQSP